MVKKALLFISIAFLIAGCKSTMNIWNADSNMKKIELDMTKEQVIKKMGNEYHRVGSFKADDGTLVEILGYQNTGSDFYILQFENGILKEWHKEMRSAYPTPAPLPTNTDN